MNYTGINETTFNIILDKKYNKRDILNDFIILKDPIKIENGFKHRLEQIDIFNHRKFLYKYSNWLWFKIF